MEVRDREGPTGGRSALMETTSKKEGVLVARPDRTDPYPKERTC
jgi:hypothetical protein